jgi:hypothetical protein
VSFSAATASALETASQKPDHPSCFDCQRSAAIGSATMIVRNAAANPREKTAPAFSLGRYFVPIRPKRRGVST